MGTPVRSTSRSRRGRVAQTSQEALMDAELQSVQQLEQSVKQRAEELRKDVALLQAARRRLLRREALAELRRLKAEEARRFETYLHSQAEEALGALEGQLEPASQQCEVISQAAAACAEELRSIREEVVRGLLELEEAARKSEEKLAAAASSIVDEQRAQRRERIAVEMRLMMQEIEPGR
eukprot:TRINITY_DN101008_c0_g1_i1.p1 TRINITY_DN101008_c0_g1~~TRINITY_DN101008_c0_g1_i1.p1  ORF type:complete len:180 (-),score=60.51 TRINITY_DN101008_c0_g1_i1:82-621(-)